jgi:hypothetical protein
MKTPWIVLVLFALFSCEDTIYPGLGPTLSQYAIDAWVTDLPGEQKIFVAKSQPYFDATFPDLATGAEVYLIDDDGNRFDFLAAEEGYVWGDKDSDSFVQLGMTYQLNIHIDGHHFLASATLRPVPPVDSILFAFEEKSTFIEEDYYLAQFVATDLMGIGDTYWIKSWKNSQYLNKPTEINIAYDAGFSAGGNTDGVVFVQPIQDAINPFDEMPDNPNRFYPPYQRYDTVYVEIHSLNEAAFYFLNEVKLQTNRSGGFGALFAAPFSNVPSNIYNKDEVSKVYPVGAFNVSAVSKLQQILTDDLADAAKKEAQGVN